MKAGETLNIVQKLNLTKPYDVVRFRLSNGINTITKDLTEDSGGVFVIPLYQEDTHKLEGRVSIEAEVDFEDKSVRYSNFNDIYLNKTLGYDPVENNQPSDDDGVDLIMESIEQGVAVVIGPESAEELITRVTELFQDTKDIAQSVRDDADAGEFDGQDGQDGYSPQVTVKTETPSTYVLHIKDADHEFDTPNLQGQGGEGSIEVGDGLKRVGKVVSVDLSSASFLKFNNGKLELNMAGLAINSTFRATLSSGPYLNPLASKSYVDEKLSGRLKKLIVTELPTEDIDKDTIYMILRSAPTTNNIYDEYLYMLKSTNPDVYDWELIGSTEVDLSNYYTKIQTNDLLSGKVDKVQSLNNLVEFYSGSSNDIDVTNYSFITFDKELQDGDELTLYKSVDGVWHQEDITDSWYAYIFDADEIYFVLDTSSSSGTREVKYSVYNDVIRQRQYSREIGELQKGKADKSTTYTKTEVDDKFDGKAEDTLTLATNTESSAIRVFGQPSYNTVRVVSADIEEGEELHLIQLWDDEVVYDDDITDQIGMYLGLDGIDEIKFKVVSQSSSTRHISYQFNNPVARTRETNAKWNAKQDKINASNKLNADYLSDGTTNKTVSAQEKQSWNDKISVPTSTSADNGKFLRVVNGVATWDTVPQAESNSF